MENFDSKNNFKKNKKLSLTQKIRYFILSINVLEPFSRLNFALEII